MRRRDQLTDRHRHKDRGREINRAAWNEADLVRQALFEEKGNWVEADLAAQALFEQRRRELLALAGMKAPRRRVDHRHGRRRPDPLRDEILDRLHAGAFDDRDNEFLDLVEDFLRRGSDDSRLALHRALGEID